jgi:hypothetical protein
MGHGASSNHTETETETAMAACQERVQDHESGLAGRGCGQPARWTVVTRKRDGSLAFYTPRCDTHLDTLKRRHDRLGLKYLVVEGA